MSQYTIRKVVSPVPLSAQVDGTPWADAGVLHIDSYPWYSKGDKQDTAVRLVYDDAALYAQFLCQDKHIFSKETKLHGPVCLDSCVEFFGMIDPAKGPHYFNLEINCCGVIHMGFGQERHGRVLMPADMASRITIVTSEKGPTRDESPADRSWWVAAKIPFDVIGQFAGQSVRPASGTLWKANFYRCGGKTDDQYATWSHIAWPKPDFHRPEFFGDMVFA